MDTQVAPKQGTAKSRYSALKSDRDIYLRRARKCALLTIPTLVPQFDEQQAKDQDEPYPYQSLGARGVNNLASKFLVTLLPPNSPFFRFQLSDKVEQQIALETGSEDPEELRNEFETGLQKAENVVQKDFEAAQIRPALFVFGLSNYVVRRSPSGEVMEAVIREMVAPKSLPEGFMEEAQKGDKLIEMFTHIMIDKDGKVKVYQEAGGNVIPETEGTYTKETNPFTFARMVKVDGSDYGRSYVEEHYGDLFSLETDSKSIIEISQIAARLLILVNPNGQTEEEDIRDADNGDIITGLTDDIHVLQADARFQIGALRERIADLKTDLAQSFLMNSSVQRDAERVTAAEIRYMADELEQALGGVYTILSQEVMFPLVRTRIASLRKRKTLVLPKDAVDLKIIVGVEALGRGHDLNRLRGWMQDVGAAAQMKPSILERVKDIEILERITAAHGLSNVDLVVNDAEAEQAAQQAQQDQMVNAVAPDVAKETVKAVANNANSN